MAEPHISLAAEKIGTLGGLPITNSIFLTWLVMLFLTVFTILATRRITLVPSSLQSIAEMLLDGLHTLFKSVVGEHHIEAFFPLLATIFIFIAASNWSGLLPGVGTVGFTKMVTGKSEFRPLLRGPTADLNTTLGIALISFFSMQYFGFSNLGGAYIKKYINLSNPIMFFVGLLEIVSDLSKILSFAFRLFGNIFAGEVLLTVIAFLMPLIAPLPFLGLELFVGFIQALVFSMLTAVFLNMSVAKHEH